MINKHNKNTNEEFTIHIRCVYSILILANKQKKTKKTKELLHQVFYLIKYLIVKAQLVLMFSFNGSSYLIGSSHKHNIVNSLPHRIFLLKIFNSIFMSTNHVNLFSNFFF